MRARRGAGGYLRLGDPGHRRDSGYVAEHVSAWREAGGQHKTQARRQTPSEAPAAPRRGRGSDFRRKTALPPPRARRARVPAAGQCYVVR